MSEGMKGLRGRAALRELGGREGERGRERLSLPVETPTFPMSSYNLERSLIQKLMHIQRKGAPNVSPALKNRGQKTRKILGDAKKIF